MFGDANSGMYMPVAPAQYGGVGGGMFGDSGWFVLLIILAAFGGFGNGYRECGEGCRGYHWGPGENQYAGDRRGYAESQ